MEILEFQTYSLKYLPFMFFFISLSSLIDSEKDFRQNNTQKSLC